MSETQKSFEVTFQESWDKYVELHKEFNNYRGQEINDNNIEAINKIIQDIQDSFLDMYTTLYFISVRAESATNAMKDYQKFIDALKAAGAAERPEAKA